MTFKIKKGLDSNVVDELGSFVSDDTKWSQEDVEEDAKNFCMETEEFIERYLEEID